MTGPAALSPTLFKPIFHMHIAFHRPIEQLNTMLKTLSEPNYTSHSTYSDFKIDHPPCTILALPPSIQIPSLPSTLDRCHRHNSKPDHTCISHVYLRQPAQLQRHETNHIRPRPHPVSTQQLNAQMNPQTPVPAPARFQTSNTSTVPRETQLSCLGGLTQRTKLTCSSTSVARHLFRAQRALGPN